MTSCLPINIEDLLNARGVESARIEFKASWDEATTGLQVLRTVCAFANDIQNLNGGYIVVGVQEEGGRAVLPPRGLEPQTIDGIQRWIRGKCIERLTPEYHPVQSPEVVQGRRLLVIWAPGSDTRPHQASETLDRGAPGSYWIREGSQTVKAQGPRLTQLLELTARVPYDDRRALVVPLERVRAPLVRAFLADVRSRLIEEQDDAEVYRRLRISVPVNGHDAPRNVGLLFFSDDPDEWFRGARIEVVQFAGDVGGNVVEERTFRGPLHQQLRDCITYLQNLSVEHLQKLADRPEVKGWVSYPLPALEEAVVNAVYHRSYDNNLEPTKVYLYPDRVEIISYPGPVPGIEAEHLRPGAKIPPAPARNRRIGEFLKELRLAEGRGTGIPKVFRAMEDNGSPEPRFDFDEARSYFRVTLPAHPEYVAIAALRDVAHLEAIGDANGARQRLLDAVDSQPGSGTLTAKLITMHAQKADLPGAEQAYERLLREPRRAFEGRAATALATAYLDANDRDAARRILDQMAAPLASQDLVDAAILERRAGRQERAHNLFERAGEAVYADARALHEFAQTKMQLAKALPPGDRHPFARETRTRLQRGARDMIQRVLQMDAPKARQAWAWYDLGRVRHWLEEPQDQIIQAYQHACELAPYEQRFRDALDRARGTA